MQKTFSQNEITGIAKEILASLKQEEGATIVALSGDLGAGKTTLSQAVARELGVKENVVSPTFVIMKIYELERQKWKHLIHIDAYRLESALELEKLGWKELCRDSQNLILIEWPERVASGIPLGAHRVSLIHNSDHSRNIDTQLF